MLKPIGSPFRNCLMPRNLAKKSTPTYGDQHLSKPLMAENIMAPSQMTIADTLTIIYFVQRAKFDAYKAYETELMMQCKASMKKLRSDWGGEYLSSPFNNHLSKAGTL